MIKYLLKNKNLIGFTFTSGLYLHNNCNSNISLCKNFNFQDYNNNQNNNNSPDNFEHIEFSPFENERIIRIYGEINDRLSCIIIDCLDILDQRNQQPIKLIINSGGGSISQ